MQKNSKFFEDLTRMASSAGGTFMEMRRELETAAATQVDKVLRRMDLVTRDDFNLVREMATKARAENEQLAKRVAELEKQLGIKATIAKPAAKPAPKPTPAKKPAAKKPAAKKSAAPAKAGTKPATGPKKK